ncbi:MAG: hypothetical protein WAW75_03305 [Gallionella sp.]
MLLRIFILTLVCPVAWAESSIQAVSPNNFPLGRAVEIRMQVSDGINHQFVLMPGGPYVKQALMLPYRIHDLVVYQAHGLLAAGERGLQIAEVTASGKLIISDGYDTRGRVTRIVVEDSRGWLLNDDAEVVVLDMGKLASPAELGRYHADQTITDIAVKDGYLYLLLDKKIITVIDMRTPQAPVELSRVALDEAAKKIFINGDYIYVAQPEYGLTIFDAGDKTNPKQIARHAVTGGATAVKVEDGVAIVARSEYGITLLDVADPAHVKWLGSHSRLGRVAGIAGHADQALVWNDRAELISLDIGNPELPAISTSYRGSDTVAAFWLDESTVLAASPSALQTIDFSATPPLLSNENLDTGQGVNLGGERRLFIAGDIAYVADWFSGLHLYDISTPSRPRLLSSFHTPGSAKGVVVRDGIAFVADDDHGLQVIDVRDPLHPAHIASLATSGLAYTPKLSGNLLYLASHRGGFQIIDVSDATAPKLVANINTPGKAWSLEVAGNTLYVADDAAGVLVFDVSDAKLPKQIGVFNPGGAAEDVVVRGDTAYAAFFDRGFYVLDISHPELPRQIGHTSTPGNARGIALKDDLAYVTDWFAGIQVIDISDKTSPVIVGEYDTSGAAWGIGIKGDHAYIGDWWGGFAVLNIGDPKKPTQVDRYQARGKVLQITAQGKFAYAAVDNGGVQIFDISNPLNPTWITSVEVDGNITGLLLEGTVIHAAVGKGQDSGLVVIDISDPYQAYRIRHINVVGGVQRIRSGTGRLYFSNSYGLGVIDLSDPERSRAWFKLASEINDLWIEDGRVLLATGQGLEVLDDQLDVQLSYKAAHAASLVRARGEDVFLYGKELGVHVLNVSSTQVGLVSSFDPAEALSDMTVEQDLLYTTGSAGDLLAIDTADLTRFKISGIYPLTTPATGIKIINGMALLAGNDTVTAMKLLPLVAVTRRSKNEVRLNLPKEMPAGSYHAVDIATDGTRSISYNVLNIDMPNLSKPGVTLEEFQQLLQAERKKSVHNVSERE